MKNTVEQITQRIESLDSMERFFFEKVVLEYDENLNIADYLLAFTDSEEYMMLIHNQKSIYDFINQIVYFKKERPLFMTNAMARQVFDILSNETQALRSLIHG